MRNFISFTAVITTVAVIVYLFLSALFGSVSATRVEKVIWCHCEPNGNCQTLELPQQALEQAGHVNAQGNPLHAGDHAGECVQPSATPSIDLSPSPTAGESATPTQEPTPTNKPEPDPKGSPEWEDPCFYLRDHRECPTPTPFPGEGKVFGPQK